MVQFYLLCLVFFSLASQGLSGRNVNKRTVAQIEADIDSISSSVGSFANAVNAFPTTGGTLTGALSIHTDATNVISALNEASTDISATGPISESDGQIILGLCQSFIPVLLNGLRILEGKLTALESLPLGVAALIQQDITNICAALANFEDSLLLILPADLQGQLIVIEEGNPVCGGVAQPGSPVEQVR